MNRKILGATGVVAALIVLSATLAMTACGGSRADVEEMLPALGAPQTEDDRIPEGIDLDALGGVRPETVRRLGADDTAEYWVGREGSSRVCLILHIPGGAEVTAATCRSITDFYEKGLALEAGGNRGDREPSAQAYLLPIDVDTAKLSPVLTRVPSASDSIETNLLSLQSQDASSLQPTDLQRKSGKVFGFTPLGGRR
ncbi:hypothetical protein AB0H57_17390 [Micromonospora sp. NPDC050686]|uniref:hypothetical protein n=1 Tax=Micromonospora sp. NPDC050686 TaxID=3154631 RepID=UPI0033F9334E